MSDLKRNIDQLAWELVKGPLEDQADARDLICDAQEDLACLVGDAAAIDYVNGCILFHNTIQGPG